MKNIVQIFKSILFLFLGILLLWYVLRGQDIDKIISEFKHANYLWLIVLFFVALTSHYLRALRWNLLISSFGYKPRTFDVFNSVMLGYIANLVFPRLGEITRCGVLSKKAEIPLDKLIGSVVAERLFDFICLMIIIFFTIIFQLDFLNNFLRENIINPLLNNDFTLIKYFLIFLAVSLLLLIVFIRPIYNGLRKLSFYKKIEKILNGLLSGFVSIWKVENKLLFFVYTFSMWGFYYLMVYFSFFTLEGTSNLGLIDGLTILAIGSLGVVAPVPGGIGAYHWLIITSLVSIYSISAPIASSYAFISHIAQILSIVILGLFSYFMITFYKKR